MLFSKTRMTMVTLVVLALAWGQAGLVVAGDEYDSWGGRWPWTSERLIQPDDLWPLSLRELELMRNEIYARHGWVFNRRDLEGYFARQPWYRPRGDFYSRDQVNRRVEAELTGLERRNIQIITSREWELKR